MVIRRSCGRIYRRIFGRGEHWHGGPCSGWISDQQHSLHRLAFQSRHILSSNDLVGSLSGLGSQVTARQGNALGILGVGSGVLASLGAVGFPPEVIAQFAGVAGVGALVGSIIGRRVTATELPQTVALLHSIVGLSAVLTSIGSVLQHTAHLSTLHAVTAYLGVVIGRLFPLFSVDITHQNCC